MSDDETLMCELGDVIDGDDPFDGEEDVRPWLFLSNHESRKFHGEQYFALAVRTKVWMDALTDTAEEHWIRVGKPDERRIVPWGVQAITREDERPDQGRLVEFAVSDHQLLNGARWRH